MVLKIGIGTHPVGCAQDAQQTRLARLVCVFLQNLLRANTLDVGDVHLELESFCIEYARMHEAADLYKLLRRML